MKDYIKALLDRAILGDERAWQEYLNESQNDKLNSPSNLTWLSPLADILVAAVSRCAIEAANREFIIFILEQSTLAQCPTAMLKQIIESMRNNNSSVEQKSQLITLLHASLNQNNVSSQPNKMGLYAALVLYHFYIDTTLTNDELQQMLELDEDKNGVAAYIKDIIFREINHTAAALEIIRSAVATRLHENNHLENEHSQPVVASGFQPVQEPRSNKRQREATVEENPSASSNSSRSTNFSSHDFLQQPASLETNKRKRTREANTNDTSSNANVSTSDNTSMLLDIETEPTSRPNSPR